MRANVRVNIRDSSAILVNNAFSDAQINAKLNDAMRLVQRKFYPRLSQQTSAQTGLSIAIGLYSGTTTPVNYARICELFVGTTPFGTSPQFCDLDKFLSIRSGQQAAFATPDNARVVRWTCYREGTGTAVSVGKWTVLIHPPAIITTALSALVELEQADLSADGDIPDVPPEGCTMMEGLASFWLGGIIGRENASSFIQFWPELKELAQASKTRDSMDKGRV